VGQPPRSSGRRSFKPCIWGAFLIAVLVSLLLASSASAAFAPPSFIRQWTASSTPGGSGGIAVDPFGNVFVIAGTGGPGDNKVMKYTHDGTPAGGGWPVTIGGTSGIATDPVGHVHVLVGSQLLEYTNGGGFLGAFKPPGLAPGPLAFDAAGNAYANGLSGGQRTVNEYHFNGIKWKLIHSAPYPGSPNTGFFPAGFLGLTVDADGSVYGSAISTTTRSLLKFPAALGGTAGFLEDCAAPPQNQPPTCFGGFGLAYTHADVSTTGGEQPVVFAAGGFGGGNTSNFYRMGVYATNAGPAGTSRYLGSYNQQPVPGNFLTAVGHVAASPCHAAVYEEVSVFGGPGGTFSGFAVQEFDAHATPTPCASAFTAFVKGFAKKYVIAPPSKTASRPCTPCASVLPSGAFTSHAQRAGVASKKTRRGVAISYKSSAAADTTFLFKRVMGHGPKKNLGGFVYAAHPGKNAPRFSGALRKGKRLRPGVYRVTVSAGQNKRRFRLIVRAPGR
jgi:hypothetical protein